MRDRVVVLSGQTEDGAVRAATSPACGTQNTCTPVVHCTGFTKRGVGSRVEVAVINDYRQLSACPPPRLTSQLRPVLITPCLAGWRNAVALSQALPIST
jgi:hypothetical protein